MVTWEGSLIGSDRYRVLAKLGSGGMGSVYRARDIKLDCDVVIKAPHAMMLHQEGFAERFAQEIRSLVALSHPHIVKIIDVGLHDETPFAVMQCLEGGNLEDLMKEGGGGASYDPAQFATWLPDIARALDYIHGKRYVHRDVKPGNILFDEQGNAFLSDFGIAKAFAESSVLAPTRGLTSTGMVLGTADYMAPEVVLDEKYDGRADQYSLAVTVYELLCGRRPFNAVTPGAALVEKATKPAVSLSSVASHLREPLCQTVDRALQRDPRLRFENCSSFATAVLASIDKTASISRVATTEEVAPSVILAEVVQPLPRVINVTCPSCGWNFEKPPSPLGPRLKCPRCYALIQISSEGVAAVIASPDSGQRTTAMPPQSTVPLDRIRPTYDIPQESGQTESKPTTPRDKRGWVLASMFGGALSLALAILVVLIVVALNRSPDPELVPAPPIANNAPDAEDDPSNPAMNHVPPDTFAGSRAGQQLRNNALELRLIWCPPGQFTMGSPPSEVDRDDDEQQTPVTLTEGFWLGMHEVTQAQWRQVMTTQPWSGNENVQQGSDYPAVFINWEDAIEFCETLTYQERSSGRLPSPWIYTLPTEAQWEYACRAGTQSRFSFGDDAARIGQYAWISETTTSDGEAYAHQVGRKLPNPWGLHDMHGNASEWCLDWFTTKLPGGADPLVTDEASSRVVRGGSWGESPRYCRSANRFMFGPTVRANHPGFRLACVPSAAAVVKPRPIAPVRPELLYAPFSRSQAHTAQENWARYLGKNAPFQTNGVGVRLALIPPGQFTMGSPASESNRELYELQHLVHISKPFYIGMDEVTQDQYEQIVGTNPSYFSPTNSDDEVQDLVAGQQTGQFPVERVTWFDALDFCNKLSLRESLPSYYRLSDVDRKAERILAAEVTIIGGKGYHLPTEAQWEYACRAGTISAYYFGGQFTSHQANFDGNYPYKIDDKGPFLERTTTVAAYPPNNFGVCDMHGSVREWCWDWFDEQYYSRYIPQAAVDPIGPTTGASRVVRGGCWYSYGWASRAAIRVRSEPGERTYYSGFRIAREIE